MESMAMESRPLYRINNLRFRYPGSPADAVAVDHLEVKQGETLVLLGPNGSGKSTLLKLMNRILPVPGGSIFYRDTDITSPPPSGDPLRSGTVYVHQNPLLLAGTVFRNVAYGLKLRKVPGKRAEKEVSRALAQVGLGGFEKRKSSSLSGGEAQRVAIARALVLRPEVLLLDEPSSSVDKSSLEAIESILTSLSSSTGTTLIVTTHNIPFAYRICSRLLHLEGGSLQSPEENILPGTLLPGDGHCRIFSTGGIGIFCPDIEGDFSRAVIDYDRIIVSEKILDSSARNNFSGTVEEIRRLPDQGLSHTHNLFDIIVKIDQLRLTTRITADSLGRLALSEGSPVFLTFKASSVRLY
jgi:tungstate transport system ATP-binding protein